MNGEGNGNALQYSSYRILWTEEPGGLLSLASHRFRHEWSDLACMHALKKEMATHSSILAWRIPGTEEPGGLPSMGSHSQTRLKRLSSSSSSNGKESASNAGDQRSIPGLGSSSGEEKGNPLQYCCLENPMDRGAWRATVRGVAKSWTWLSD